MGSMSIIDNFGESWQSNG